MNQRGAERVILKVGVLSLQGAVEEHLRDDKKVWL